MNFDSGLLCTQQGQSKGNHLTVMMNFDITCNAAHVKDMVSAQLCSSWLTLCMFNTNHKEWE